jgi:hypothetical protein
LIKVHFYSILACAGSLGHAGIIHGGYGITVIIPVCGTGDSGSIPDSHPFVYINKTLKHKVFLIICTTPLTEVASFWYY